MSQPQQYYQRFTLSQRIEHWVQVFAFTTLAVTGLPQKFVGSPWAEAMIAAMGGIESVRIIHRYAAVILLIGVIYHGGYVTYKMLVERVPLAMLLGWQDAKDFFGVLAYNLGLRGERPKLPRYNFEEKIEYWAFVWGTVIMVITGFMLWNPIATANLLPGSFIPAAKAAHGGEALLAVLAIIIWHMYGVHIRKFNKSMFTGKLSREEMEHEHALELEQIENGTLPPPASPEDVARRRRLFIPIGTVITLLLLAGLYWFVTFEQTAIDTVIAATEDGAAFQPLSLSIGENIHATVKEYTGPESCAQSDCHNGQVVDSATASDHSQRIAAAGPNPWLAQLTPAEATADTTTPDCLLCHAEDYQPDDLLASAQTVRAAGGATCQRCHSEHPDTSIHNEVGLACISCHTSIDHQMETVITCDNCHEAMPHQDPLLNTKHNRLDCRTCHVEVQTTELVLDTSQATKSAATGFFEPAMDRIENGTQFVWQMPDGSAGTVEDEAAIIVPQISVTILAPESFDPAAFARTGEGSEDAVEETTMTYVQSHGVTKDRVRTCATCHGPSGSFDFGRLGYHPERVDQLSLSNPVSAE